MGAGMSSEDLVNKWTARRDDWNRFKVQVDGVSVCDERLGDIAPLLTASGNTKVTLRKAAQVTRGGLTGPRQLNARASALAFECKYNR